MPSLFEPLVAKNIRERIEKFTPQNPKKWGKMTHSQALTHLRKVLEIAVGDGTLKVTLVGKLFGPFIKKVVLSPKPYKHGLPTGKAYIVTEDGDFEKEKQLLLTTFDKFIALGEKGMQGKAHPLFGKLTAYEWGFSQWKHLDHHLKQFDA